MLLGFYADDFQKPGSLEPRALHEPGSSYNVQPKFVGLGLNWTKVSLQNYRASLMAQASAILRGSFQQAALYA